MCEHLWVRVLITVPFITINEYCGGYYNNVFEEYLKIQEVQHIKRKIWVTNSMYFVTSIYT